MKTLVEPTFVATVYIAGDVDEIRRACRAHCYENGLCVTVTPTEFIYTGGHETGAAVGLLNYPRFPSTPDALTEIAHQIALKLLNAACQHSALVVTPSQTFWLTRRPEL